MKKKKTEPTQPAPAPVPTQDDIAALAYDFWLAENCPDGAELRHWLQAEATLAPSSTPPKEDA